MWAELIEGGGGGDELHVAGGDEGGVGVVLVDGFVGGEVEEMYGEVGFLLAGLGEELGDAPLGADRGSEGVWGPKGEQQDESNKAFRH